jgi:hypothetical protein
MDQHGPASPTIDDTLYNIIRKVQELDKFINHIIEHNWSVYSSLNAKFYFPDVCGDWDAEMDFAHAVIGTMDALEAAGAPERESWDPLHRAQTTQFEGSIRRFLESIGWEWALRPDRREHSLTQINKFKEEVELPFLESALVLYKCSEDLDTIEAVQGEAGLAIERKIDPTMTLEDARTTYAELIRRQEQGYLAVFTNKRIEVSSATFSRLAPSIERLSSQLPGSPETVDQPLPHADDRGIQDDQEQTRIGGLGQDSPGMRELWVPANEAHADAKKLGLDRTDQTFWRAAGEGQFQRKKIKTKSFYEYGSFMRWVKLRLQDEKPS